MTEFRMFCIAAFVSMSAYATFSNRIREHAPAIENAPILAAIGFTMGCIFIAAFGRRSA